MRPFVRFAYVCFIIVGLMTCAAAQTTTRARRAQPVAPAPAQVSTQTDQTNVDEDFELNIVERRITEHDFFASTSIALGEEQTLLVRIGVALGAQEIDVLLRNVRGRVRFRASLDQLRRVLDARRTAPPAAVAVVPAP